jgi:hypothetical protein
MLKVADGPDEVHKMVVARRELNRWAAEPGEASPAGTAGAATGAAASAPTAA